MTRKQVINNLQTVKQVKIDCIIENLDTLKSLLFEAVSNCEKLAAFDDIIPAIISDYEELKAIEQINTDAIL